MVSVGIYAGGWEQELILQGPLQLVRVTTNQTLDKAKGDCHIWGHSHDSF